MIHVEPTLSDLTTSSFEMGVPIAANARTLRLLLRRNGIVRQLASRVADGSISDQEIEAFAGELIAEFDPGTRFPHQLALAALAVALESRYTPFAQRYLAQLGALRLEELRDCIDVARECLGHRERTTANRFKTFEVSRVGRGRRAVSAHHHVVGEYPASEPTSWTPVVRDNVAIYG